MKYYKTKEEANEWNAGYHDVKYGPGKGYYLVVNRKAHKAHYKRISDNIKRMQHDHRMHVQRDRRNGIMNNHLCSGCDRIIGGGRQICSACIHHGWVKIFKRERMKNDNS